MHRKPPARRSTLESALVRAVASESFAESLADFRSPPTTSVTPRAQLVVLRADGQSRAYLVGNEPLTIGRGLEADIRIEREEVSRAHARITQPRADHYVLEDLSSRNGTRVNGAPIDTHVLRYGDRIHISSHVLVFTHAEHVDEQLQQVQKLEALGQLAGGIAHDFGNLLAAVQGNVAYLGDTLETRGVDDDTRASLRDIERAVERGAQLTRQLLELAHRRVPDVRSVDLHETARDVLSALAAALDGVITTRNGVPVGTRVQADPMALTQILTNLALNARDALLMADDDGRALELRISAHEIRLSRAHDVGPLLDPGRYIAVVVEDNGCGMDAETRRRIFEPMYSTKQDSSPGLGLSMVYNLVRDHGGHVQVDSEPGKGTRFTLLLPAPTHRGPTSRVKLISPTADTPPDCAAAEARALLLLDPGGGVHGRSARTARQAGFRLVHAAAGVEALEVLGRADPADAVCLLIIDQSTPLCEAEMTLLRARELAPHTPAVLLTDDEDSEWSSTLLGRGARATLHRPCDATQLRAIARFVAGDDA